MSSKQSNQDNLPDMEPPQDNLTDPGRVEAEKAPLQAVRASSFSAEAPMSGGEDLLEEVFSTVVDLKPADILPLKVFYPWHRPRKHYVRVKQWCRLVQKLIKTLGLSPSQDARPLKYLTMPGDELLDIRTLHGVLEKTQVPLQFLGVNRTDGERRRAESQLSEIEVKNLPFVNKVASKVLIDSLQQIGVPNSPAYKEVSKNAPYDVINIDLCDSALATSNKGQMSYFLAFHKLFELQISKGAKPWLFFLTTYANKDSAREAWDKLGRIVEENNKKSAEFKQTMVDHIGYDSHDIFSESVKPEQVAKIICIAISKWLIRLVLDSGWSIEIVDSKCYTVGDDSFGKVQAANLYSIAFWVERPTVSLTDPTGIVAAAAEKSKSSAPSETNSAIDMVKQIASTQDVDDLMKDQTTANKIISQAIAILRQARHNVEKYQQWVDEGCPPVSEESV